MWLYANYSAWFTRRFRPANKPNKYIYITLLIYIVAHCACSSLLVLIIEINHNILIAAIAQTHGFEPLSTPLSLLIPKEL